MGKAANDYLGIKVSGLGDVNGDGFADFGGSAHRNDDGPGANNNGAGYIIYGRTFPANLTLDTANSEENVRLLGNATTNVLGEVGFSAAGDVNDDGLSDIFVSAQANDAQATDAGAAYIIYGSASLASSITMGNNDVTVLGKAASDFLGFGVPGAGDINNDDGPGANNDGAAYIFFGSGSLSATINLNGAGADVTISGKAALDYFGRTAASRTNAGP